MQPSLHPFYVINPRVLKRSLENRVENLMLTKIKFISLKKLKFFTFDNIENQSKELLLVNGCIVYFKCKLEDSNLQIVCLLGMIFQRFFIVLSSRNREETFCRWECESTIYFKTTLGVFVQSSNVIFCT